MRTRSQNTKFMDLPNEMKAEIFSYLDKKSRLQVRFACSNFKTLIDTYVGLTIVMKETDWPRSRIIRGSNGTLVKVVKNKGFWKTEFLKKTCVRRAWITKCKMTGFFRYPLYLQSILLGKGTSAEVVKSLMKDCKNLVDYQMQAIVSERIGGFDTLLPRLRTLSFFMDPSSSMAQWDTGAYNVLQMVQGIRAPGLRRFYMDTWTSSHIGIFETAKALIPFLFYHANLFTVIIGINHMNIEEPQSTDIALMNNLAKYFIEPIFHGLKLSQKFITLSNLKMVEFQALYPYLKAQTKLEKLTVTNWLGRTQKWMMYTPIFEANALSLRRIHISIETDIPFDFQIVSVLQGLKELALFVNGVGLDQNTVNAININTLPEDLEMLILSNFLMSTQDLKSIPLRMTKLKIMAIVQIRGIPSVWEGMRIDFVQRILTLRSLEAVLLCGVWLPISSEKKIMENVTQLLTGRKDYFLITDQNPNAHNYWKLIRMDNTQNANLSFHLLLPY